MLCEHSYGPGRPLANSSLYELGQHRFEGFSPDYLRAELSKTHHAYAGQKPPRRGRRGMGELVFIGVRCIF
jgi:hypothetical protein